MGGKEDSKKGEDMKSHHRFFNKGEGSEQRRGEHTMARQIGTLDNTE